MYIFHHAHVCLHACVRPTTLKLEECGVVKTRWTRPRLCPWRSRRSGGSACCHTAARTRAAPVLMGARRRAYGRVRRTKGSHGGTQVAGRPSVSQQAPASPYETARTARSYAGDARGAAVSGSGLRRAEQWNRPLQAQAAGRTCGLCPRRRTRHYNAVLRCCCGCCGCWWFLRWMGVAGSGTAMRALLGAKTMAWARGRVDVARSHALCDAGVSRHCHCR